MNKYNKIVFVNGSAPPLNADNLNHMDEGIERATDGAIALETEIATARGGQNSLGARFDTTDANLASKANKSTTLAGYGITDAYTKERTDQKLAQKLNNKKPFEGACRLSDCMSSQRRNSGSLSPEVNFSVGTLSLLNEREIKELNTNTTKNHFTLLIM